MINPSSQARATSIDFYGPCDTRPSGARSDPDQKLENQHRWKGLQREKVIALIDKESC